MTTPQRLTGQRAKGTNMTESPYLRPADAAEFCRVSRTEIYRWAQAGELPLYKHGNRTYFKRPDLTAVMESKLRQIPPGGLAAGPRKGQRRADSRVIRG